ncbi:MAG TPA: type I 3-dehydroquinate dehydratase [Spirochaetia bacterium]|nr:type I 3-dehydroquinate dehydratase [Spirochaetales bacterium]HRY81897.1 type I 3-dehydroquinate dehydratase [Spirochaetia bacterium]
MKLCLVVAEETVDQAAETLGRYDKVVPIFEVRADFLADLGPDSAALLRSSTDRSLIFTARLPADGGRWTAGPAARRRAYERAVAAGFDYVDLEIGAFPDLDTGGRTRVIRSFHDMGGMPRNIREIFARACGNPGEIPKIAVTLNRPEDTVRFLEWNAELRASGPAPRVVTAMGRKGAFSRILGSRLGIEHTYVPVPGKLLLPGMVGLDAMTEGYGADRIGDRTEVYGLVEPSSTYVPPETTDPEEDRPGTDPGADAVRVPFVLDSEEECRALRDFFRIERFYSRNNRSS